MGTVDESRVRIELLRAAESCEQAEAQNNRRSFFSATGVVGRAMQRLGVQDNEPLRIQAILVVFHQLCTEGYFCRGSDGHTPFDGQWIFRTERAKEAMHNLDRDPLHGGYIDYLDEHVPQLNPISRAYMEEAQRTFRARCFRAAAVLIGAASECLIVDLARAMLDHDESQTNSERRDLDTDKVSRKIDGITKVLSRRKPDMPDELQHSYSASWHGIVERIRVARNKAGHPEKIETGEFGNVYTSFILFQDYAPLTYELIEWIEQ